MKAGDAAPRIALVILAAGLGSRYGGLKQLEQVGPGGETILEYSVFDAIRAGFTDVHFVIRRSFVEEFERRVAAPFRDRISVHLHFQELDCLPEGFAPPEARSKPWGTGHALYVVRESLQMPFAVLNADDFYGAETLAILGRHLRRMKDWERGRGVLAAFQLGKTLSPHGSVSRGICSVDRSGCLAGILESSGLSAPAGGDGSVRRESDGRELPGETLVSMNAMGFREDFLEPLEADFIQFLKDSIDDPKAEFYLPSAVTSQISREELAVEVETTASRWLGVTYPEDRDLVQAELKALHEAGAYPRRLWS